MIDFKSTCNCNVDGKKQGLAGYYQCLFHLKHCPVVIKEEYVIY